jgi:hypothetical protein
LALLLQLWSVFLVSWYAIILISTPHFTNSILSWVPLGSLEPDSIPSLGKPVSSYQVARRPPPLSRVTKNCSTIRAPSCFLVF